MNPLDILYIAAAAWIAAAVTGLLAGRTKPGLLACCAVSGVGGAAAAAGGGWSLVYGDTPVVTPGGAATTIVGGPLELQMTSLAGVFAALLGIVTVAIALYAPRYHEPGRGTAVYLAAYNLALLACLAVLTAGGMVTFLVAWETMSLTCYLLILRQVRRDDVARGAFWFLALSEIGFLLVVAAFVILASKTHATGLDTIAARAHLVPGGWRAAAYLLALVGFGFKAGLVPLHVWLPEAHPVAPADGSAFLSGLVVKLGIYGIVLFAFRLAPAGAWPGLVTMGAGAMTAAIGILYALRERDIKRFLAYSTIENAGIIVTAFGAAMIFHAYRQPALAALLLLAGLYHVANHGCYKTLLFLEAGVVEHTTGTRDMDRLGGLVHRLPRSAVIAFVGTLGIAALPPLNGFVSEWLIFQGLFQGFRTGSHLIAILIVVAAATLGLTGGLAIYAFVRGFGIPYLGMPRTRQAAAARETGQPIAGPALLAVACVALAVGAPVMLTALSRATRTVTGVTLGPLLLPGKLTVIPAHTDFSAFSPTYLTVFLVAACAIPLLIFLAGRPRAGSVSVPVWDGGIVSFKPRMQYSAMTFSAPTRVTFDALYRPDVSVRRASDDPAGRSGPVHYESEVTPVFERYLYRPVIRAVEWLADAIRPLQSGDVNLYLLYVFAMILLAYLLGAV
ncbi:MAG TPA: proton-conducting transporter membrane subunit [Streptosporangiaceae bacterium]|nr:proton-conducting transporter membrane subunit [Streptosporangiaceae bacterium]